MIKNHNHHCTIQFCVFTPLKFIYFLFTHSKYDKMISRYGFGEWKFRKKFTLVHFIQQLKN